MVFVFQRTFRSTVAPNCLLFKTVVISPELKRQRREGGQLFPCSTKVKNERSYTSASPVYKYLCGVSRDKFTDTFLPYVSDSFFHRGESTKVVAIIVFEN